MEFLNLLAHIGTNEWVKAFIANNNILISCTPIAVGLALKAFAMLGPNTPDDKIKTMLQGIVSKRVKKNESNSI